MEENQVEKMAHVFRCYICMCRVKDAMLCPHCSKLCCYQCIRRWLTEQKDICPHCRSTLRLEHLVNCRWAEEITQQIESLRKPADVAAELAIEKPDGDECQKHKKELNVYCSTCQKCICHQCALWDRTHEDHFFKPLNEVYEAHLADINKEQLSIRRRILEIVALYQDVDKNVESVSRAKNDKVREIKNAVDEMIKRLDNELGSRLSKLRNQKQQLSQESEMLENVLKEVNDLVSKSVKSELIRTSPEMMKMFATIHKKPMASFVTTEVSSNFTNELVPAYDKATFTIRQFSQLRQRADPVYSQVLYAAGLSWRLKIYPDGNGVVRNNYLSVFLELTTSMQDPSLYEYRVEMVHLASNDPTKSIIREFSSIFEAGECWGYNRFFRLDLLSQEGYLDANTDTLVLKFQVRAPNFAQKCRDLSWQNSYLETKLTQNKELIRSLKGRLAIETMRKKANRAPADGSATSGLVSNPFMDEVWSQSNKAETSVTSSKDADDTVAETSHDSQAEVDENAEASGDHTVQICPPCRNDPDENGTAEEADYSEANDVDVTCDDHPDAPDEDTPNVENNEADQVETIEGNNAANTSQENDLGISEATQIEASELITEHNDLDITDENSLNACEEHDLVTEEESYENEIEVADVEEEEEAQNFEDAFFERLQPEDVMNNTLEVGNNTGDELADGEDDDDGSNLDLNNDATVLLPESSDVSLEIMNDDDDDDDMSLLLYDENDINIDNLSPDNDIENLIAETSSIALDNEDDDELEQLQERLEQFQSQFAGIEKSFNGDNNNPETPEVGETGNNAVTSISTSDQPCTSSSAATNDVTGLRDNNLHFLSQNKVKTKRVCGKHRQFAADLFMISNIEDHERFFSLTPEEMQLMTDAMAANKFDPSDPFRPLDHNGDADDEDDDVILKQLRSKIRKTLTEDNGATAAAEKFDPNVTKRDRKDIKLSCKLVKKVAKMTSSTSSIKRKERLRYQQPSSSSSAPNVPKQETATFFVAGCSKQLNGEADGSLFEGLPSLDNEACKCELSEKLFRVSPSSSSSLSSLSSSSTASSSDGGVKTLVPSSGRHSCLPANAAGASSTQPRSPTGVNFEPLPSLSTFQPIEQYLALSSQQPAESTANQIETPFAGEEQNPVGNDVNLQGDWVWCSKKSKS